MRRGEIWTVAGGGDYAGKPRPVVILRDDRFGMTRSVTVPGVTTNATDAPLLRSPVEPSQANGLRSACHLMVDQSTTVPKSKFGARVSRLADQDIVWLNRAVVVFLGIGSPPVAA